MTLGKKQELFSRFFAELLTFIFNKGYQVRIGEVFRPEVTQRYYRKIGRSKAVYGNHQKKLAADIHIFTKDGVYLQGKEEVQEIGDYWESLHSNCRWGGNWKTFKDVPHFELNL